MPKGVGFARMRLSEADIGPKRQEYNRGERPKRQVPGSEEPGTRETTSRPSTPLRRSGPRAFLTSQEKSGAEASPNQGVKSLVA
jgi:hypothetical protein